MRATTMRWVCLLLLMLGFSAHAQDPQAGDDFLKLVDAKKYGESWDQSSDFLNKLQPIHLYNDSLM